MPPFLCFLPARAVSNVLIMKHSRDDARISYRAHRTCTCPQAKHPNKKKEKKRAIKSVSILGLQKKKKTDKPPDRFIGLLTEANVNTTTKNLIYVQLLKNTIQISCYRFYVTSMLHVQALVRFNSCHHHGNWCVSHLVSPDARCKLSSPFPLV